MALIKLTAFLDNISGKLNGTVFAQNRGGHYVRSKSNPTNPRSDAQMNVRGMFGMIAALWRGLTQGQRDGWDAVAQDFPYQNRLGDTKTLSGFALHQKLNQNLALINESPIVNAPQPIQVISIGAPALNVSIGAVLPVTTVMTPGDGDAKFLIYATPPLSNGVKNFQNRLRLIAVATEADVGNGYKILQPYTDTFGVPVVGQKIGVAIRAVMEDTGQASVIRSASFTLTA